MTQDEIIEMARQAGLDPDLWNYTDAFERFATLVAEHEREKCAKLCESYFERVMASRIRTRGQE